VAGQVVCFQSLGFVIGVPETALRGAQLSFQSGVSSDVQPGNPKSKRRNKIMNSGSKIRLAALALSAFLGFGLNAAAQTPAPTTDVQKDKQDVKKDRKDLRKDRRDRNADQKDINKDKRERSADEKKLQADKKAGASDAQIAADRKAVHSESKDISKDRKDRNADQKDINKDRKDVHKDAKDIHKDRKARKAKKPKS
jgi:hypothetical protein